MNTEPLASNSLARFAGAILLAQIIIGIGIAMTVGSGIDINLSADVREVAGNMLAAEERVRAKAYFGVLALMLEVAFAAALYRLVMTSGPTLALWSLAMSLAAALVSFLGAVFVLNVAELAGDPAYQAAVDADLRFGLAGLQVTSDYTSFHLSLVASSLGKLGFFWLLLGARLLPVWLAGWGVFASGFVATAIVTRDFVPLMASGAVTTAFMVSNLIAMVGTALYLLVRGTRTPD